ncbi:MAG: hypothetical protein IJB24_00135 [Clostridia bacterium]|nr:hypothetical protein [Clostridia bacterium]MBQ4601249.1 hypothetical protein [Clostridia bacterium]
MYQRSYPPGDILPPNYKGNAFDTPRETPCDKCEVCDKKEVCEQKPEKEEKKETNTVSSIFTRRDGSSFALDDIILGGLIVLLLNSHADDELLLVLVLLFISGI